MISGGPVRPETAAAALSGRSFSGDFRGRGDGTAHARHAYDRVATGTAPRYQPLSFSARPPFRGKVAPH
jgi:hypothetical protein